MPLGLGLCGHCCVCTTGQARFKVFGCTVAGAGSPIQISGVSVVVKRDGVTVATVISGSSAFVSTGAILSPGTYDVTVNFNRYNAYATTVTISSACNTVDTNINLTAPAGMVCCSNLAGKLVPNTLYWTDSNGTWTLSWNTSLNVWLGCATQASVTTTRWDDVGGSAVCSATTGSIPYAIRMTCTGSVSIGWKTVKPCSGTQWLASVQATCNVAGTVAQPAFDSSVVFPINHQTASATVTGAAVLGNVPISGTMAALPATVGDGGGHVVVPPVTGTFAYAE